MLNPALTQLYTEIHKLTDDITHLKQLAMRMKVTSVSNDSALHKLPPKLPLIRPSSAKSRTSSSSRSRPQSRDGYSIRPGTAAAASSSIDKPILALDNDILDCCKLAYTKSQETNTSSIPQDDQLFECIHKLKSITQKYPNMKPTKLTSFTDPTTNMNALSYAVSTGSIKFLETLLEISNDHHEPPTDLINSHMNGRSMLYWSVVNNKIEMTKYLIEYKHVSVNHQHLLVIATKQGNIKMIELLSKYLDINELDEYGKPVLYYALNTMEIFTYIINNIPSIDLFAGVYSKKRNILHQIALLGEEAEIILKLLESIKDNYEIQFKQLKGIKDSNNQLPVDLYLNRRRGIIDHEIVKLLSSSTSTTTVGIGGGSWIQIVFVRYDQICFKVVDGGSSGSSGVVSVEIMDMKTKCIKKCTVTCSDLDGIYKYSIGNWIIKNRPYKLRVLSTGRCSSCWTEEIVVPNRICAICNDITVNDNSSYCQLHAYKNRISM
jgi:hypothetical protein